MSIWGFLDPLRASLQQTIQRLNEKLPLIEANVGEAGAHVHAASDVTTGVFANERLGASAADDYALRLNSSLVPVWKTKNAPLVGMVDVTDYGYTVGRINTDAAAASFAGSDVKWAMNAAIMATIDPEYAEAACTSATATTVTVTGAGFAANYPTWDDTIDAGAGADYSHEVCWLSGDQKGKWCYITSLAGDVITFVAHPYQNFSAPAAGDRFCVVKSARTQQRWAIKCLWIPPGRARVVGEIDGLRGIRGNYWMAAGYNTTMLQGISDGQHVNRRAFTGSTTTTITDTTQAWTVNAKAGRWLFVWEKSSVSPGRQTLQWQRRILSNTATELTVETFGSIPAVADYDYAIGERSVIHANGSAESCFTGISLDCDSQEALAGRYRFGWLNSWKQPSNFSTDAERVANSNTQNTFIRCLTTGPFRDTGFQYANRGEGGTDRQVDNLTAIDCRFKGAWTPGSSTDRSISVCCARVGSINGNAVINKILGGASTSGQSGIIFETDITAIAHIVENCGVYTDNETGGFVCQGISHIAFIGHLRMEGCSRILAFATASIETTARLEITDVDFAITDDNVFAEDGYLIKFQYPGGITVSHIRAGGDDPQLYATPRPVRFWFNNARGTYVRMMDIQLVQTNIEDAFPSGLCNVIRLQGYKKLTTGNSTDETGGISSWGNEITIVGTLTPNAYVEHRPYLMAGGSAPDTVGPYRKSANVLTTDSPWVANGTYTPGTTTIPTGQFGIYAGDFTLTSTQTLTVEGTGRLVLIG